MLKKDAPLRVKPRFDPGFIRWGLKFNLRCNERDMMQAAAGRKTLLNDSRSLYDTLMADEPFDCDWDTGGSLFVFSSAAELDDLHRAFNHAKATGKPTTELTRDDFPLTVLAAVIAGWMKALQGGAGFLNVTGLPTHIYDTDDLALIHWGLGAHMGTGVSQNAAGDLLSHIRDVGANAADRGKRLYKTNVELGFQAHRCGHRRRP